jgi:LmbE family N-acetylglucosaminyl deacetylase
VSGMLELSSGDLDGGKPRTILCIGAHCDDIEIGCGGSILTWLMVNPKLSVTWVVLSSNAVREKEARRSAETFLIGAMQYRVIVKSFRNGYFPFVGADVKDFFEKLKTEIDPDLVLTHYREDRHQDHRVVSDLTWNTFRNHFILEYEIPKFDGDLSAPNVYVPIEEPVCSEKTEVILDCFASQAEKRWFSRETFLGLMRLRGIEANSASGYAEAFYCRKAILRAI